MKVTIVSATTGQGHNSTASALATRFSQLGAETDILDLYKCCGQAAYRFMEHGYLFATRRMKSSYRRVYNMLEESSRARRVCTAAARWQHAADCLLAAVTDHMPDVFVVTHPFATQALDLLKKRGDISTPVVALVTDYCVHPFIEDATSLEAVNLASPLLLDEAARRGLSPDRTHALGLPVSPAFLERTPKDVARRSLGLDEALPTALVMGGSMGYGDLPGTVSGLLASGVQVICVFGANDSALRRVSGLDGPLLALGFTDNVPLLMDASDLIVTKPGGLTVTELIVKGLPAVLAPPIPGQEERNRDFLLRYGGAVCPAEDEPSRTAAELLCQPMRLSEMSRALLALALPHALEDVCALALSLV